MKKIFITGAAGFIGAHAAKHLHARGDEVLGYDNFNSYYAPQLKRDRASLLKDIPIIEGDLCDRALLEKTVAAFQPTHILHLAAQAGVRYSLDHPHEYVRSNIDGFLNILELCRRNPEIILVYASSSSVYGLNQKIPFSIEDRTDNQASFYGVTKKCNELMASTYHHLYGLRVTGLRFFTVYGPWGRPDMAYHLFTQKINNGEPIQVYNNGNMMRDFTYIDDIIRGTVAALDKGLDCALFNLGNNRPVELNHFIDIIANAIGKPAIREFLPMQLGDVEKTYADIDASLHTLNFSPQVPLEKGIPIFVDWFKDYYVNHKK